MGTDCARNAAFRLEFSHPEPTHQPVDRRADTNWAINPTAIRRRLGDRTA